MASARGPDERVISAEEKRCSPPGMDALSLARASIPPTEEENVDGKVDRAGRAGIELHAGRSGPEREAIGVARGGHVVETNARGLIEVPRGIPRNRHVCLEEGTLSGWLYEMLEPHVEELVVTGIRKSRGPKSDKRDAFAPPTTVDGERLEVGG